MSTMDAIVYDEECQTLLNPYTPGLFVTNGFPLTYVFNGLSFSPPKRYQLFSSSTSSLHTHTSVSTMTSSPSSCSSFTQCSISPSVTYRSVACQYELDKKEKEIVVQCNSKETQTMQSSSRSVFNQSTQTHTSTHSLGLQCEPQSLVSMHHQSVQVTPLPKITISTSSDTEELESDVRQEEILEFEVSKFVTKMIETVVDECLNEIHEQEMTTFSLPLKVKEIDDVITSNEPGNQQEQVVKENEEEDEFHPFMKCDEDGYELVSVEEAPLPSCE